MRKSRFTDEQMVGIIREADRGPVAEVAKRHGISEQLPVDAVTYYHGELPEHDVLLADGLPAESYLDSGNRSNFANGGG